jgi:ABC-type sugar transport system permease subunit
MGYLFISPFIVGFILFILAPVVQSVVFSTNRIIITSDGFDLAPIGTQNYEYVLFENADFLPTLLTTTGKMLNNVFWVVVFSFFAAVLLNQRFQGRLLARTVFFLPVIVSAGVVLYLDQTDYLTGIAYDTVTSAGDIPGGSFLSGQILVSFLLQLRIPRKFLELVASAVDMIPDIINAAGVQILVFLAGLQSISPSLYEASEVEGATAWENFWMITFPMLTPLIITNIVYTIVDFFISPTNEMIRMIRETTFYGKGFGASSAMMWVYFASIAVVLAIVMFLWSRISFNREK